MSDERIHELKDKFERLHERVTKTEEKLAAVNRLITDLDAAGNENDHIIKKTMRVVDDYQERGERIAQLERVIDPDPEGKPFQDMSRDEKVYKLRSKLVALAKSNGGKYRMKYRDVKNFFDGQPSPGHTYDLMQLAGEMDGFEYDTDRSDEKRVRVNLEGVNDESLIRGANKTPQETPA